MNLEDAVDYLYNKANSAGVDQFDILAGFSESTGVEIFQSKIQNTEISSVNGIGIRLFVEGRPGISFTEKFSTPALDQTLKDALSNSKITNRLDLDLPEATVLPSLDLKSFEESIQDVHFQEMVNLGMKLEDIALHSDERIENVPYLGVGKSESSYVLRNSKGVSYSRRSNSISAYLGVTAALEDQKKMGVYANSYRSFQDFNPQFMASKAVSRGIELLGAKPISGGNYPILFSNRISTSLMGMFLSPYFAESVQKERSRLKGRLGEKIASEKLNLICDPHIPGMPGSKYLDSEGVPTSKTEIIKDGVLKTFLYNLESAKKDGVKPTGHGSRGHTGKAGTTTSNLFIPRGTKSTEELLKTFPKMLYITKLEGGSGCSSISGDISIGVQGFYYENGERVHPVDKITLSGNYFDMIQMILDLSNEYSDSYSSVKMPDILVESMAIAG